MMRFDSDVTIIRTPKKDDNAAYHNVVGYFENELAISVTVL